MQKSHDFDTSLNMGRMGVQIVKGVLSSKYGEVKDYDNDVDMQKRGIDLYCNGLGFVEVKVDSHSSERLYFELSVCGKPGAVDRCSADYYLILFFKEDLILLIKRPELQKWLREHWNWIRSERKDWIHTTYSNRGKRSWYSIGVVIPKEVFTKDVDVGILTWKEKEATKTSDG